MVEAELRACKERVLQQLPAKSTIETEQRISKELDFCHDVTKDMIENTHCAIGILNDLLNYDRIETGALKLELGLASPIELVQKNFKQFKVQAANQKVQMTLSIDDNIIHKLKKDHDVEEGTINLNRCMVIGDHLRLGQAVRNIISNALKFTSTDGRIEVSASFNPNGMPQIQRCEGPHEAMLTSNPQLSRSGSIIIQIQDSGVGLSSSQLKQIFGEGVQFDANRLQHGGGSGLGLAITKGIIEQHNGTIQASSDGHGHGTTFIIELPLYASNDCESIGQDTSPAVAAEIDTSGSGSTVGSSNGDSEETQERTDLVKTAIISQYPTKRRILVVEDVPSSRKMLVRLLERSGHVCDVAGNGELAVRAIEEDLTKAHDPSHIPFDTILMDFEMPVMNGPDATEKIRQLGYESIIFGVTVSATTYNSYFTGSGFAYTSFLCLSTLKGNVLQEDVEYFKEKGANDVIGKPISMKELNNYWEKCWNAVAKAS